MQQSLFNTNQSSSHTRTVHHHATRAKSPVITSDTLNPAQYEAATTMSGPVLVIAGAGSGKTRTLVYRMAHLVEQGVAPEKILLLTFTRKAAEEMLNRTTMLLDESCRRVVGGTFHATANMLLRRHCHHLGYPPNFTIIDQSDAEGIINLIRNSLNLANSYQRFPTKKVIISILSKSVNKNISIEELLTQQYSHLDDHLDTLMTIRSYYHDFKMEHGLMDYDDLLLNWHRVISEVEEVRENLMTRFSHIMVDEYQDTNPVQAKIVRLMANADNNIMVVGDDSQSIYSFRGADFRNIMDFPDIFPGTRIIRLEQNYRSTQFILSVTNAIIDQASEKHTKVLHSSIEGGEKPIIHGMRDEAEQARFVAEKIKILRDKGAKLREIAVLFRAGFHSYKLELELNRRQIDFEKRGGLKLIETAHIKDMLSYLRIIANPMDHMSWNRILLQLNKVGPKTVQKILIQIKNTSDPIAALADYPAGKSWRPDLINLAAMLKDVRKADTVLDDIFETIMAYYQPLFERIYSDDYPRRSRDLDQLKVILNGYPALQDFLDATSLDPPQPVSDEEEMAAGADDRLILSTVHSAKGLEWDTIFIINLAQGKFPAAQATLPHDLEEERRLLYVAATRARKQLYFLYPQQVISSERFMVKAQISSFLAEIPAGLTNTIPLNALPHTAHHITGYNRPIHHHNRMTAHSASQTINTTSMRTGTLVKHTFFGEGYITSIAGPRSVNVNFKRHGKKTLHLDYTKLEIREP